MKRRYIVAGILFAIWAMVFATADTTSDTSQYGLGIGVLSGLVVFISPLILQYVKLNGLPMILLAIGISLAFSLLTLLIGGGFAISWKSAVQVGQLMVQFFGLQQIFYTSLRDNLHLNEQAKQVIG